MELELDVNSDLFRVEPPQKIVVVLARSLAMDGSTDDEGYDAYSNKPSLADKFEYVMYGRVFKFQQDHSGPNAQLPSNVYVVFLHTKNLFLIPIDYSEIYASFGGLLMCLKGDSRHLQTLELDQKLYLLIRCS